jgi:L-alanine-DL-glutamate epimerase-like enolase superfamily enzyme
LPAWGLDFGHGPVPSHGIRSGSSNPSLLEVHPDEERHPLWDHGYIGRAEVKGNTVILPETPGFGVEFNPDYLDRFGTKLV